MVSRNNLDAIPMTRPTYQEILHELLATALDVPTRHPDVRKWCMEHMLEYDAEVDNNRAIIATVLTPTGETLLSQNVNDFRNSLLSLHRGGHLKPQKATNGTQENDTNHDTQQQGHDGGKGKAQPLTKGHPGTYEPHIGRGRS
jgi:hypothetical protein